MLSNKQNSEAKSQGDDVSEDKDLDPDATLQAFEDGADERARALAILALGRQASVHPGKLAQVFAPLLSRTLGDHDTKGSASSLRLLVMVCMVSPDDAHSLMFDSGLSNKVFPKVGQSVPELEILRGEILAALCNHLKSRQSIAGLKNLLQWIETAQRCPTQMSQTDAALILEQRTALLASLSWHKLHIGASAQTVSNEGQKLVRSAESQSKEDLSLYDLATKEILRADEQSLQHEQAHVALLAALEALSYLTVATTIKNRMNSDPSFLRTLFGLLTTTKQEVARKDVFPSRGTDVSKEASSSAYSIDPSGAKGSVQQDTSVHLALSAILLNFVGYRAILSDEEKKMAKLQAMAASKQKQSSNAASAGSADEGSDEADEVVDARVSQVIKTGGIELIVKLTFSGKTSVGSSSQSVSSSTAVKDNVAAALLHMLKSNDKVQRGRIAQAGGVKSLVALSNDVIARLMKARKAETATQQRSANVLRQGSASTGPSLDALQALSKLCITASPAILFGSPTAAVTVALPVLTTLYLHPAATPLQRFESLLALTNLASLSPETAAAVAQGRLRPELDPDHGKGEAPTVTDGLEQSILLEDNHMIRRAAVELLCNLAQADSIFGVWSGEQEDQEEKVKGVTEGAKRKEGRAGRRLHLLVALCAPTGDDKQDTKGTSTSLATRLASAGALAMLCSSPTACRHLVELQPRTLNILSRLIKPGTRSDNCDGGAKITEITEKDDSDAAHEDPDSFDEEEEARLEGVDAASWPQGPAHARASLALRGVTIAHCLSQYISWKRDNRHNVEEPLRKLQASGLTTAMKQAAVEGAKEMQSGQHASGRSSAEQEALAMRGEVTKVAFEALKCIMDR